MPASEGGEPPMRKQLLRPSTLMFQPRPTFPYSPGAKGGGLIFTAGQVAWDKTGRIVGIGDVRRQTSQTLKHVVSVLKEGGARPSDVLKCNVYLPALPHFQLMNQQFASAVPHHHSSRPFMALIVFGDTGSCRAQSKTRKAASEARKAAFRPSAGRRS